MTSRSILLDEAIQVDPDEGLSGIGAPVTEQAILDVLGLQRLAQQWIVAQVDHAGGEIVAGAPVGVDAAQFVRSEGRGRGEGCERGHAWCPPRQGDEKMLQR